MKNSHIEWTDHTFNPWEGCTKVSPGCAHCYAEARNRRFAGGANWGPGAPRRRTSPENWKQPERWNDDPMMLDDNGGHRRARVFCASLADWLDNEVPIKWRADLLDLWRRTPNLVWMPLTKRPENWRPSLELIDSMISEANPLRKFVRSWLDGRPPENIWVGATVEDQRRAEERIPHLMRIPCWVRFLSCEPLLEAVNLDFGHPRFRDFESYHSCIHWVICGGESGPGARPMETAWAHLLRDQCAAARVPFFFKQWGEHLPRDQRSAEIGESLIGPEFRRVGKHAAGRLLDGVEHNEFPA